MIITREHLELAAKAVGLSGTYRDGAIYPDGMYFDTCWRPHRDLAQAWELAEKLSICLDFRSRVAGAYIERCFVVKGWPQDAATPQECVVLLAAEIGKMKP